MSKEIRPKDPRFVEAKADDGERDTERKTACVRGHRKSARKVSCFRIK